MASVTSLGLHQPSGLHYAIEEQILPANPSPTDYKWEVLAGSGTDEAIEDELLITKSAVIWSRGRIICKTFKFDLEKETITHALLANFPTSIDEQKAQDGSNTIHPDTSPKKPRSLQRALVVFLKSQAHIYFLSGTSHVVHMPFEVEYACAGPVGVLIQRKEKETNGPVALKFPRVAPNSFVSSQLTSFSESQNTNAFAVDGMGRAPSLQMGLNLTLENMLEPPISQGDSQWPRIVSLTDPLSDVGLVVTDVEAGNSNPAHRAKARRDGFLDPMEELLHIEEIKIPGSCFHGEQVVIGVTVNREAGMYTIWRLKYLEHDDPFIRPRQSAKAKAAKRRSSIAPAALASEQLTPGKPNLRESFGVPLPGKRSRKSERLDKPIDPMSSLEQQDKEGAAFTRRSSRRLSSMLARADLSTSQDRSLFADVPSGSISTSGRRPDSYSAGPHGRSSSTFSHNNQVRTSLSSLLEAPFDLGLNEGFHNMGLDDHEFDGLQHDVIFSKVYQIPVDKAQVHLTDAATSPSAPSKVFIICSPSFGVDEQARNQLLIGIQDTEERQLNIIILDLVLREPPKQELRSQRDSSKQTSLLSISSADHRKARNVVDACKLVDGDQSSILVLSESMDGRHEMSTQAPWSERTPVWPSLVFVDDTRNLQYRGRKIDRDVKQRKSEVIDLANGNIVGLQYPRGNGVIDAVDVDGRLHQLQIQLRPNSPQVQKVLDICRHVLDDTLGDRIHGGWLHAMQWLSGHEDTFDNAEWSATTIIIFSLVLSLGHTRDSSAASAKLPVRKRRPASGSFGSFQESTDWNSLEYHESANSLGCPPWLTNKGWDWALDEEAGKPFSPQVDSGLAPKFISKHITLAREFMNSTLGIGAVGEAGYLPTSQARDGDTKVKAIQDILAGLHLLLEEQKLDIMTPEHLENGRADLRTVLCQVSRWLKWHRLSALYELGIQDDLDTKYDSELKLAQHIAEPPIQQNVIDWIQKELTGSHADYTTPVDDYATRNDIPETCWDSLLPRTMMFKRLFKMISVHSTASETVEAMQMCKFTRYVLETLPEAVAVPMQDFVTLCQPHPPQAWSGDLLELVKRSDISSILSNGAPAPSATHIMAPTHTSTWDYRLLCQSIEETNSIGYDDNEGTERQAVIRALFKDDRRLNEAQNLLSTHKARVVYFESDPSWPESEYLERQKDLVSRIATGTLAIAAGRSLLYYSLRYPLITQKIHIGGFNLNCIVKPTNVTVGVDKSMFTEEKVCWGFFHQGVSAGLAISPHAQGIDTSWILYNKPGQELSNRHAGFLLALGLNGHLKGVAKWVAFKYLTPKHTMTSIGLLLGLAASYMGTMDSLITRLLSVHATRMLPRGAAELNLSPLTQTSGIMGIGLLYCNSQHRRMSEIMLSEIEHVDDEEEEEPLRSECYRLAAGFALGFINLGKGNDLKGLHDMRLTDKLITHATATKVVEIVHVLDRAAAGAVMAIALIFMKTEDQIVARKIDVPDSILQFDYVRPDILLLRTVAKNIIMWSKIEPSFSWIQKSLPAPYRARHRLSETTKLKSADLPFFSILAGVCFSIALRFSGSASTKVRDVLLHYLDQFMRIATIPATPRLHPDAAPLYDEELARENARMCQDVLALSCSIVMAGTGDIPVLRRLRSLHGRDDPSVPYGSHLAAHLAIGALFLGCGTVTFGTSNIAIASLLLSFYPIFPTNVMDNRSHLQAFRHFWVLAAEQRCLVAKDVLTGQPVSIPVQIKMNSSASVEGVLHRTTPCLLPPLDHISSLSTNCGPRFWDVRLDFSDDKVRNAFGATQSLYLRRRPPREGTFTSTLRALGDDSSKQNPFQWLFDLEGLQGITYAEKAVLLEDGEHDQEIGAAVDARMEIEKGIMDGDDLERLEGAKLLFEWSIARDRLKQQSSTHDSQATITASKQLRDEHRRDGADGDQDNEEEAAWWMRDSDIEDLKAKVWLAAKPPDKL